MAAAAVSTFSPTGIAGLGLPLDKTHMDTSCLTYNSLPNFEDQPQLQVKHAKHINALLAIIARHSMGDYFRVHSAHRHELLPAGTVRLEAETGDKGLMWNRATAIDNADLSKLHASFFKVVDDKLVAFEFADGASPIAENEISTEFIAEYAKYLTENDLTNLIALEVGDFTKPQAPGLGGTAELEVQWGDKEAFTVVVPLSILRPSVGKLIPTGWNSSRVKPAGGSQDADGNSTVGTHYCQVVKPVNTHKVFVDSAESVTPDLLSAKLEEKGIIIGNL